MSLDQPPTTSVREAFKSFADGVQSVQPDPSNDGPLPTPEVLDIARRESVWQLYLAYFIDPNAAHGFDHYFLDAFLDACDGIGAFDSEYLHPNRARVNVEVEVGTEEGRRPDVLVWDTDRWFLLLELKVDSDEGEAQTSDYASAKRLGPLNVKNYTEDSSHYGFIAPIIPADIDSRFKGIPWHTVGEAFARARNDLALSEYPLRSVAQLDDFLTTIETNMTHVDERTRELARLFFEYRDEIKDAEEAVDDLVDQELQHEWVSVFRNPETQPSYWDSSWHTPHVGIGHGSFARKTWESADGVFIRFEHRPTKENFRAGDLELGLEIRADEDARKGGDPRERFCERFVDLLEQSQFDLPDEVHVYTDTEGLLPGHSLTKAYYSYEPGSVDGYYEALHDAAVDHEFLVPVVDKLF